MDMLTLLGVGHVFRLEDVITSFVQRRRPRVVCIELDRSRYEALRGGDRKIEGPLTYRLLARFQRRMAQQYGTQAGAEMRAAADAAEAVGARLALIDTPVVMDAQDMMSSLSTREKLKFMGGALISPFISQKKVEHEMKKFEEDPETYLGLMEKEFPELSKNLIENRNRYMSTNILTIHQRDPDVIAVVGDGHIPGISRLVDKLHPEVIRLKELRRAAKTQAEGGSIEGLLKGRRPGSNVATGFSYLAEGR